MIPKIIHYCWLSDNPIPKNIQNYLQTWKEKLPEYEFILWNFERFDINSSNWVKQAFNNKKYAFAADYIRLFAIYNYGGIYLDMDVEVLKSFNPLLNCNYILGYEGNEAIEAGIFGAQPKAEWVAKCLAYYTDRDFILPDGKFDTITLPRIMYKIIASYQFENIKSYDFFTAKSYETEKYFITDNTYCIHHFSASWLPTSKKLKKRDRESQVLVKIKRQFKKIIHIKFKV